MLIVKEPLEEWFLRVLNPGYGYVIEKQGRKSTRPGFLTSGLLQHHLGLAGGEPQYLAIRPNTTTNWIALDIDQKLSPHHPDRGERALEALTERCRLMGLSCSLQIRSSYSRGIHLWFPLPEPIKTFKAALSLKRAVLTSVVESGIDGYVYAYPETDMMNLGGGILEVFPNDKAKGSDYRAIRMPCTGQGNGIFVDGFGLVDEPGALRELWEEAAPRNCLVETRWIKERDQCCGPYNLVEGGDAGTFKTIPLNWIAPLRSRQKKQSVSAVKGEGLLDSSISAPVPSPKNLEEARKLLSKGWNCPGQTQSLLLAALMVAGSEFNQVCLVEERVKELLTLAPGFINYSGHIEEILNKQLPGKSACYKAASFDATYKDSWKEKANIKRSVEAADRARSALQRAEDEEITWDSTTSAIAGLLERFGAPQKRWWYKQSNHQYLARLKKLVVNKYLR